MKKLLFLGLLAFTTACQSITPTSIAESTITATLLPPLPHVTATRGLSPTPAFSPTPIPLYFTEEFDSALSPWVSFQTGGGTGPKLAVKNGLLRMDIDSPNTWYYLIHNAHEYKDVFVTAKFAATSPGSIGLICRYSDKGWYEFNISSDGTYTVLFAQSLGDGIAKYTPITNKPSEYLQAGNLGYEIGLTCQDQFLLLHINGKLFRKLDVARFGLTEGRIGILTSSFDTTPMIATFDWVKVSEPDQ
jgi:hypothetical protein